jgi:hypothetical protein
MTIANTDLAELLFKWRAKIDIEESIDEYCKFILENKEKFILEDTVKKENENVDKKGLIL